MTALVNPPKGRPMPYTGDPTLWEPNTQQGAIVGALFDAAIGDGRHTPRKCATCDAAYLGLRPRLGTDPLRFWRDGVELGHGGERGKAARHKVYEVHKYVMDFRSNGSPEPSAPVSIVAEPEPAIIAEPSQNGLSDDHKRFLAEVRRIRPFAKERDIDHISYRPVKDGARMISAGIPVEACLHAMTMHWDDADRRQAGIQPYDPARDFPGGMAAYLDALVEARIPIYLYGPAGMGKSYWAEQLADRRAADFGFTPMTEGATVSWLLGRVDAQGFKPTKLLNIWKGGGVYLFDEADAADPNMLLVMNGPLANHRLDNPVDQETYWKHDDCILLFAGNTDGQGATDEYGARNAFDFSTFDRLRMGRAFIDYDENVELEVMLANV